MEKRKKIIESISVISILSFFLFIVITTYISIDNKYREFNIKLKEIEEEELDKKKENVKNEVMYLVNYINNKIDYFNEEANNKLKEQATLIKKLIENNDKSLDLKDFYSNNIKVSFIDYEENIKNKKFQFQFDSKAYLYFEYIESKNIYLKLELLQEDLIDLEKKDIIRYIDSIKWGNFINKEDKYIFINTYDGVVLSNSTLTDDIGKSIKNLKTSDNKVIHDELYKTVINNLFGGFVKYKWKKPSLNKEVEKISFVYGIEKLRWIIGSGIYLDDIDNKIVDLKKELKSQIEKKIKVILFSSIIFFVFYLMFLKFMNIYLYKDFKMFKNFFEDVITYDREISEKNLEFEEFFLLAGYANRMLKEKKILENKLIKLANKDELTQISNRKEFIKYLDKYFEESSYGEEVSMMMIDLDCFKKVNDNYGNEIGDKVLKEFSELVKGIIREADIFGRLGGEEFAILLPKTNLFTAKMIGERIVNQVYKNILADKVKITVSIGISYNKNDLFKSSSTFLNYADKNLYKAKNNGKNQVCI